MTRRRCAALRADGRPCRAAPQIDRAFCFIHDPERAAEVAEAQRLGGLRRHREATIDLAYDIPGLEGTDGIWRVLEIAVTDTLSLDNELGRNRTLIYAAATAARLVTAADVERRLRALEAVSAIGRSPDALDELEDAELSGEPRP